MTRHTATLEDYDDINYIKNRVEEAIQDFCDRYDIKDLKSESQNVFNGLLRYIYEHVFQVTSKLKHDNRSKTLINLNHIDIILDILDYYIYLCDVYCKASSIQGFCTFTGIDVSILYDWGSGVNRKLNPKYSEVIKRLDAERERTLSDLLVSGKRQPVGIIAVLNHEKGWNLPGVSREVKHVASSETPEQIAERYRAKLADGLSDN